MVLTTMRKSNSDPADVWYRAVGLDLQSRPIEYKDFQSAGQQCTEISNCSKIFYI